ncbi:hypothetical protein DYB35_002906 [Aphanomyces astaci]|uniref:Uncharacterized protein n=1 Tax=Aphanomyces astaci TaxID=112090 RepID=A0A418DC15_APHAT|nr:hypothetical protein DYB35_002906 [Aphanomyces astaci]
MARKQKRTDADDDDLGGSLEETMELYPQDKIAAWKEKLKKDWLMEAPDEFFALHSLAASLHHADPSCAFAASLGVELTGPFDLLSATTMRGSFELVGASLAQVLLDLIEVAAAPHPHHAMIRAFLTTQCDCSALPPISKRRKTTSLASPHRDEAQRRRSADQVAPTLSGLGIVVPVHAKSRVGYRDLPLMGNALRKLLEAPVRGKAIDDLITRATIACDECDFGTALQLGLDLWTQGAKFEGEAVGLMESAYMMLGRGAFGVLARRHIEHRNRYFCETVNMLARLGGPSPARKKYEEVLLLPRKQLQHMDLSPPKPKVATSSLEGEHGSGVIKRKELSDDENNAIWRRWKDKKDAERRRRRQAKPAMSDQELTPLVEQTIEESSTNAISMGVEERGLAQRGGIVEAEFLKWKQKKDGERRREKQRKREMQASWGIRINYVSKPKVDPVRLQQVQEKVLASPYAKPSRRRPPPHGGCVLPQLAKASVVTETTRPVTLCRSAESRPSTEASAMFIEAPAVDIEPSLELQHFPSLPPQCSDSSSSRPHQRSSNEDVATLPPLLSALTLLERRDEDERDVDQSQVFPKSDDRGDDEYGDIYEDRGHAHLTAPPPPVQERDATSRGTTSGYGSETWE